MLLQPQEQVGFSGCDVQAWLLQGMWNLPGPGIKPISPALAGGFSTIVPPRSTACALKVLVPKLQIHS